MVKEDLVEEVYQIKRFDDRMMKIAMMCGRKILHIFSLYISISISLLPFFKH